MDVTSNNSITDLNAVSVELNRKEGTNPLEENTTETNIKPNKVIEADISKPNKEKEVEISPEQLEMVAQQLQDFVGEMNKGLEFLVDKDSGRDVIKVIDKDSGDLIKQYPSEEVLSLVSKLSEAAGTLVNEKI